MELSQTKGIKAAAARARKALGELGKLAKARRAEIQEKEQYVMHETIDIKFFEADELEETTNVFMITLTKKLNQTNGEYGKVNM